MSIRNIVEMMRKIAVQQYKPTESQPASPLVVEQAEQTFYIQYLRPGMVVFDVGANTGELSLLFSRFAGPTGSIHSFEASPETFAKLKTIVELTDRPHIQLNNVAVSDHVGVSPLHIYDSQHAGWTTLADRPLKEYGIDLAPIRVENVKTTSVDVYCTDHGIGHIDLLKIDVEGAEYQVLRGAKEMLLGRRIGCCVFEFGQTTFDMGNTPNQIESFISGCGYTVRNIIKDTPPFPGGESAATARFSMCVCTPKP